MDAEPAIGRGRLASESCRQPKFPNRRIARLAKLRHRAQQSGWCRLQRLLQSGFFGRIQLIRQLRYAPGQFPVLLHHGLPKLQRTDNPASRHHFEPSRAEASLTRIAAPFKPGASPAARAIHRAANTGDLAQRIPAVRYFTLGPAKPDAPVQYQLPDPLLKTWLVPAYTSALAGAV